MNDDYSVPFRQALALLRACCGCDLIYDSCDFFGGERDKYDIKDYVDEFLAKYENVNHIDPPRPKTSWYEHETY